MEQTFIAQVQLPFTKTYRQILESNGVRIRTVLGSIMTGSVPEGKAQFIASLPFVIRLESGYTLYG